MEIGKRLFLLDHVRENRPMAGFSNVDGASKGNFGWVGFLEMKGGN